MPVTTEPSRAIPRAAPSSYAVSETADAAPACSLGTLERMTSAVTVKARPAPSPPTNRAMPRARPPVVSAPSATQAARARPTAARPPATAPARRTGGRSCRPRARRATAPTAAGSSMSPASSGERPWTSWRNWERKNTRPDRPRMVSRSARTAPEKPRWWKSRMSRSGESRVRWRRTNQTRARDAEHGRHHDAPAEPVDRGLLHRVHDGDHADQREPDAEEVPGTRGSGRATRAAA